MFNIILCLDTILVCNAYFDLNFERLKRVLHVLRKETLIYDLKKYMSCTYDPGILVSVLSVHDKQVQYQRSVSNKSIDHTYQPEVWRCMYSRKMTSKLQGSFFPKFSFTTFYMFFRFCLPDSFPFDTCKMDLRSNPFKKYGIMCPWVEHGQNRHAWFDHGKQ